MGHSVIRRKASIPLTGILLLALALLIGCGGGGGGFTTRVAHHFDGPTAMVVTPDPNDLRGVFLYVVNSQGDTLSVMDTKFRMILKHHSDDEDRLDIIRLGGAPFDIAITEDGNWLYVTDALDGVVRRVAAHPPYDVGATDVVVRAGRILLPLGQPDSRAPAAYVTSPDTNELVRMAARPDGEVETGRIDLPGTPVGIAATPNGALLMITTEQGDLVFVDADPFQLLENDTIHLGGRPGNLLTDRDGEYLFAINNDPPQIQVIDLIEGVLEDQQNTFDVPLADMTLAQDGTYLYITSQAGRVFVFSTRHHRACGATFGRVFFQDKWPQSDPVLIDVEVVDCVTRDEQWYVEYQSASDDWKVTGTISGVQATRARTNQYYLSDQGLVGFRILAGVRNPSDGDTFYFETEAGVEPIRVGLVPDGVAAASYWKEPEYDLIFVANTGTHNISILYSKDHVNVGAVN